MHFSQKVPITIYADFECFIQEASEIENRRTTILSKHEPSSFHYAIINDQGSLLVILGRVGRLVCLGLWWEKDLHFLGKYLFSYCQLIIILLSLLFILCIVSLLLAFILRLPLLLLIIFLIILVLIRVVLVSYCYEDF